MKTQKQPEPTVEENAPQVDQPSVPPQDDVEVWKAKYIRALADYQNLQKRTETEKEMMRVYVTSGFLKKLLPVIDDLERAETHVNDEGLTIAMKQVHAMLVNQGVKKIEVVGKPFDPYTMECIEVVEGKKDMVIREVTPGYALGDTLLREAKVTVGGGETPKPETK